VTGTSRRRVRRAAESGFVALARLGALAVIVVVVFGLVVLGIGNVPTSRQWTLLGFAALAAGAVAIAYARLRGRVTAWAEGVSRRSESVPDDAVRVFSRRVSSGLPADELLPVLVESLRTGLGLTAAEVWIHATGVLDLALADPPRQWQAVSTRPAEEAVALRAGVVGRSWLELWLPALVAGRGDVHLRAVPMMHGGELIGLLVVERDASRPPFAAEDEKTLALLARQAALAFRSVRLDSALEASLQELRGYAEALRESRARVVAAGDAERRRIERDLHDGAQQHLLGVAVNLRVARELAASNPARADAILAELSREVHAALDELRDLAHGIYPPLLAERGLPDAVRGALARTHARGTVSADGIGRYTPSIESTAYFCCVEGIQNAAKHAPGSRVLVRFWCENDALLFEIRDDGPGFSPGGAAERAGMTNMRDRIGALGGTLRVDADPGTGTRVTGALPLVSAAVRPDTAARL
jgi:signal transduction histidine kinase